MAEQTGVVTATGGNIPEGIWVLNRQRSSQLMPADQILWIIKDDGKEMIWVLVSTDDQGVIRLNTWSGFYDGDPAPVGGTPMVSQINSKAPGTLYIQGHIEGMGPFFENCAVTENGRRFVARGEVTTTEGVQRWVDDFEWLAPSPGH